MSQAFDIPKITNDSTFFTVLIPTRNRGDTLYYALKSVLDQDYQNYKVVVCDNASDDNTRKVVLCFADEKVVYLNPGKRLSMSENWEYALDSVKKGWVTILGDDDALLPGALKKVDSLIQLTNAKAIRSNGCSYAWPLDPGISIYGWLRVCLNRGYKWVDSSHALKQLL